MITIRRVVIFGIFIHIIIGVFEMKARVENDDRYEDGNFKASKRMIITKIAISRNPISRIVGNFERSGLGIFYI